MEKTESTLPFLRDLHAIFVDTNIDTHLAMTVSLHDTISDVKEKIRAEHALCFQDIGEISIRTMKVKRRGFFYNLADSMCVWSVFNGTKGRWFVCVDAVPCPVKSPEIVAKKGIHDHVEGLSSKLPHENIPLQNSPAEKHVKRKMKSSKRHEAHLSMPFETQSSQVTLDPGNEADASICLEKCPIGPIINLLMPNDGRDVRMAPGIASSFEVTNQNIKDAHSMETCMVISSASKKPIEDQLLQFNSEDQKEKYVNMGQETNGDVRLKKPEEIRVPLQLPSEFPSNSYCSTYKLMSRSNKVLESKEANDQLSREFDTAKCMNQLNNIEDEVRPVDEAGISALTDKLSYEELATSTVSKIFSHDEHQGLDNEIVAAASLKGVNKDSSLMRVDSRVLHKSRVKKKLKTKSSRAWDSTDINGYHEHFSSDCARVCWNDVHESNTFKIIKPADQKANREHCVDTMIKISSSSMEDSNQNQVSHENSGYHPLSMLNNLSEVSNVLAEEAPENTITSHPTLEVQAMTCCSKNKSKCEPSELGSPEVSDVELSKSNKKFTGSNVGGSDPSKLANGSNQKIEQHYCIDARLSYCVSDEDSSKIAKMPQLNLFDSSSCKKKDLCEQSNAKVIIKGAVTDILSVGALTGSTKYKCGKKKSKKEVSNAQVSSEMSKHMELCGHDDASINFSEYLVSGESKHIPTVHTPTDLVQSVANKSHVVEDRPEKGHNSHHSSVVAAHDPAIKDSTPGNEDTDKSTSQSRKQKNSLSRTESNLSLHEAKEYQKLVKKPQDYRPQTHFQPLKQDGMGSKQAEISKDGKVETPPLPLDCGIGNIVSNDEYVQYKNFSSSTRSSNLYVSSSEGMINQVVSTESTETAPYHLRRFRVARKIPIRRSKRSNR